MGKLIMVRHGESEGNAIRRFTTSGEAQITELGRRQAHEAAQKIKLMFRPTLVIASTYLRARETGRIIAEELQIPIELEHELREQSLGELAGRPYESVQEDPTFDPKQSWLWRPAGGESHIEVRARVAPVLDRIVAKHPHDELVIVSHGGVMRCTWAHVTGKWEDAHVPPNCGIVLIEHREGEYLSPRVVHGEGPARETGG
ncbi:MAG: histidine phosphatase family protein [Candidatus Binatus sp.]|uniref:histidine phosphatase family protein n=1 Tax=Candidatus Binatus sp. TaxID=2811406 RepID=UPI00271697DD|nr:histidine phosphatase family protein [Candidatus Binatus sp.]MDO8432931.1 histidine phosphatase family protein [Candidatus Binatus sp.]